MANTQSSQPQSQTQKTRPMNDRQMTTGQDRSAKSEMNKTTETETKSIGAVIGDSIGKNAQAKVDEAFSQASQYFDGVKSYLRESPREAIGIGLTLAAAGWVLLYTKPGRQIFDKGAATFGPQITESLSELFSNLMKTSSNSNRSSAV